MKKLGKTALYCLGMALLGAGTAVVSIVVKTIIEYYWGK